MTVVTRFAPSPTGFLHIGGVRTAIFNYLFAKHHGGLFRLRIEDTDKARSTQAAVDAILDGMRWMGLDADGEIVFQASREERHREVVQQLLDSGHAYRCYASAEELKAMREAAQADGRSPKYDGRWRDRPASDAPEGIQPAIRFKAPQEGATTLADQVQGDVTVQNAELDDLVIARADGTPTYNLAVVVDDHDMGVTHVIRGDDHLNNAFKQAKIYEALGWDLPVYAHIPLIHGADGAKMSKRHGALGVDAYRDEGFLADAVFNYLLRLGWSHGDEEIISREQATGWFGLEAVNKGPSRFDVEKLKSVNAHYIAALPAGDAVTAAGAFGDLPEGLAARVAPMMEDLAGRSKTLIELADHLKPYVADLPAEAPDEKGQKALNDMGADLLNDVIASLQGLTDWSEDGVNDHLRELAKSKELKLGKLFMPLRVALTMRTVAPSVPLIASALGKENTLARLEAAKAKIGG